MHPVPQAESQKPQELINRFTFEFKKFSELNTALLYEILALRSKVFIVEQQNIYLDPDAQDFNAIHVMGRLEGKIMLYARILFPDHHSESDNHPVRFGRLLVHENVRNKGYAKILVQQILKYIQESHYKTNHIKIAAQAYLMDFYQKFGFEPQGDRYYKGSIAHIDMIKSKK